MQTSPLNQHPNWSPSQPLNRHACSAAAGEWAPPPGFRIDPDWFDHPSRIHGVGHTVRVMILADALYRRLLAEGFSVPPLLYRDLLTAALIHDLGRRHDGACRKHGKWAREGKRHIAESDFLGEKLSDTDWERIGGAVEAHSLPDAPGALSQGSLGALLKDADALDRVRLGDPPDFVYFRHAFTKDYLDMAWELYRMNSAQLESEFFSAVPAAPSSPASPE
jgi:hypothetical protein